MDSDAERTSKAQALAVAQAVRDALVDRTLFEHAARLEHIDGVQREMAASLAAVDKKLEAITNTFREQAAVQQALATAVADQQRGTLKRWQIWTGLLGVIAAYGSMVGLVVTSHP